MPNIILYVTASSGDVFGGGKRVFFSLIQSLDRSRFTPIVACAPGIYADMLSNAGVTVLEFDPSGALGRTAARSLREIAARVSPAIVHSHGGVRADYIVSAATRSMDDVRTVSTVAVLPDSYHVNALRKLIYKAADKKAKHSFDTIVAVSNVLRTKLVEDYGLRATNVVTIRNGIDISCVTSAIDNTTRAAVRDEFGIESRTPLIGAFGRLVWEKGFDVLIRSLASCADTQLLLVGGGPETSRLRQVVADLHLSDRVIFAGFRDDVARILAAVDVVAIPSFVEGCPMITLEAMAVGAPLVASNIPGIAEQLTHAEHAMLVEPGCPQKLADALTLVLSDAALAKRLTCAAKNRVESDFSLRNMVDSTTSLYRALLAESD